MIVRLAILIDRAGEELINGFVAVMLFVSAMLDPRSLAGMLATIDPDDAFDLRVERVLLRLQLLRCGSAIPKPAATLPGLVADWPDVPPWHDLTASQPPEDVISRVNDALDDAWAELDVEPGGETVNIASGHRTVREDDGAYA